MKLIRETNNYQLFGQPGRILIKNLRSKKERLIAIPDLENVEISFNKLNDTEFDLGCRHSMVII